MPHILKSRVRPAFTLLELLVTCIIMGVLLSFAAPTFFNLKRREQERQAKIHLITLRSQEEALRQETYNYAVCANTTACNTLFHLSIDMVGWDFSVVTPNATSFCAEADNPANSLTFSIRQNQAEPAAGGCP